MSVPDRSDKKAFAEYVRSVVDGFLNGRKVETITRGKDNWWENETPDWNWYRCDYRLAPEAPAVEPFTFENAPETLKVRRKNDGQIAVARLVPGGFAVYDRPSGLANTHYTFIQFADQFEQLDGSACGTLKAGEWPKWFTWTPGEGSHVWRMDSEVDGELILGGARGMKTGRTVTDLTNDPSGEYKQIPAAEAEALIQKARAK